MDKRLVIELDANSVLSLADAPGTRLECLEGTVWITEDGSRNDVVLDHGRSHEIGRHGRTVVQALHPTRMAVHAPRRAEKRVRPHLVRPRLLSWAVGQV